MGRNDPMVAAHVRAPAKVNLYLEVLGRRPDGYHEIRTIMQAVSLYDELSFTVREDGQITLEAQGEGLPGPDENLVVRAARLLRERAGCALGASIALRKGIPIAAGLGGGSSDCAAALRTLNRLWGLGLPADELARLAAELGSDVPFFIRGGTSLCEGRGERVCGLNVSATFDYLLVMPGFPVSTAEVYGSLHGALTRRSDVTTIGMLRGALESGDVELLSANLYNDLQGPAFLLAPELHRIWRRLQSAGPRLGCPTFMLSGSGGTLLGPIRASDHAWRRAVDVTEELGVQVSVVHSLPPTPLGRRGVTRGVEEGP